MSKADLGVRMLGGDHTVLKAAIDKGMLGRKSGKGFYLYPKDAKKGAAKQLNPEMAELIKSVVTGPPAIVSKEDIQTRLITRFVNEAAFALQDGVIRAPADGDIGAVYGIGFPPFLGGPFRMLDIQGTQKIVDQMLRFRDLKGPQFEPCQLLKDYAASGKKFHM
jgi:enoyl-CoA hydratase/long-chain 3-hydroxyacyl-CoA dehydrogenase